MTQLREMGCNLVIIGVTGNMLPADVEFFKSCGANDVVGKPVDISLLEAIWRGSEPESESVDMV